MLTRCPNCQTAFRVTQEQLKLRQGKVRCGECLGVFNALESLADEIVPVVAMTVPPEVDAGGTLPGRPEPENQPVAAQDVATEEAPAAVAEIECAQESFHAEEPVVDPDPEWLPTPELAAEARGEPAPEPERVPEPEPQVLTETVAEPVAENTPEKNADTDNEPEPVIVPEPAPEPEPEPAIKHRPALMAEPSPEIDASPSPTSQPRGWVWLTGLLPLVVLALGQLIFIYRVEIAAISPAYRQALIQTCPLFKCEVPRPRKPDLVSIESSDLAPELNDRLLLTASLKNRAHFDQEYPHLELTLTDTRDAAILRKVMAPAEYLPAENAPSAGFAAKGEVAVRLLLEAQGVPALGCRLYLFYP